MGLTVECAMVIFFSCLLFSQMDNKCLQQLEVNLASNPPQKIKGMLFSTIFINKFTNPINLYDKCVTSLILLLLNFNLN